MSTSESDHKVRLPYIQTSGLLFRLEPTSRRAGSWSAPTPSAARPRLFLLAITALLAVVSSLIAGVHLLLRRPSPPPAASSDLILCDDPLALYL
ncbi:hypothetical protein GUJ93_ZPchr0005g14364 [Zizania palustris]|uniref:Uncharacterized protein n=1 Tax=Zizania palustris TaxID=103762 RepID=A0A8J5W1Y6_ZIZPA|nr:hypothetical protein GUJ93_ZPchr0005g14364 [Zizania palustris]